MLEATTRGSKLPRIEAGLCRHRSYGENDAIGDAEAFGVAPGDFPDSLRWTSYGAEALGTLAQVGFVEGDPHGDDVVAASAGIA
jgi:hypothetical protein